MKKLLLIFNFLFYCTLTFSQIGEYKYKEVKNVIEVDDYLVYKTYDSSFFYASSLLTNQNLKAENNTEILQNIINSQRKIVLPNFKIVISSKGLTIPSNTIIIFDKETELMMEANNLEAYELLRLHTVENVSIYNARLTGDRKSHTGTKGEWGHGISIKGSKNIKIEGFDIRGFYGDGIYVGREGLDYSKSIDLLNGIVDLNRRNGISVTSVKGLTIKNVIASNTFGTEPNFGLDIEPNSIKDEIDNILIKDFVSINNYKGGIMISLNKMINGVDIKETNIVIENFSDYGSVNEGFVFAKIDQSKGLKGGLVLNGINVSNNKRPIIIRSFKQLNFKIEVDNYNILSPTNINFDNKEFKRINFNKQNIIVK